MYLNNYSNEKILKVDYNLVKFTYCYYKRSTIYSSTFNF